MSDLAVGTLSAIGALLLGWLLYTGIRVWRRRRYGSDAGRATRRTLAMTASAARHLRDGLNEKAGARAARDIRALLGVDAVAFLGESGAVAWDGVGEHHLGQVSRYAARVFTDAARVTLDERHFLCADPDCPVRTATLAPILEEGKVSAVLVTMSPVRDADLTHATQAVAEWVTTQVETGELTKQRTRTAEAELRALRAQIDPHFIYNALATIATFVRTDPPRARELLLDFADFTRYSLQGTEETVPIARELENVERYLTLERARFGDRLQLRVDIDPAVTGTCVPYLVIQPLVENAVKHGIEAGQGCGLVELTAVGHRPDVGDGDHRTEPYVEVTVSDNGAGAQPDEVVAALSGAATGDSLGLSNIHARLRHTFGAASGLNVTTSPGAGMTVVFRVPWR